jgi:formylmethanofuran dehydrogenase subunit B
MPDVTPDFLCAHTSQMLESHRRFKNKLDKFASFGRGYRRRAGGADRHSVAVKGRETDSPGSSAAS